MTPQAGPTEAEVALDPTGIAHTDVAVIGGGVAGLALAAGLLRLGLRVLVLERSSTEAGARGFAFMLMGNGLQELDDLGLLEAVRRCGHSSYRVAVRTPDGTLCEERQIDEHLCVRRADLVDALAQQLPEGVLRTDAEVVAVEAAEGSVSALRLADGTRVQADLYVGADGSHSVLRHAIYTEAKPRPDLVRAWLSVCTAPRIARELDDRLLKVQEPGLLVGAAGLSCDEVLWYVTYATADHHPLSRNSHDVGDFVRRTVGDWADPVPELIARTDFGGTRICRTPDVDLPSVLWSGNTVLIGDAAHPLHFLSSLGATTALEDAAALTQLLALYGLDHLHEVLPRFEAQRRPVAQDRLSDGRGRIQDLVNVPVEADNPIAHL